MKKKIRVGVIFGGRSSEHEVSLVSATSVINALDGNKYEVIPIAITQEGRWLTRSDALRLLKNKSKIEHLPEHVLLPDPRKQSLVLVKNGTSSGDDRPVDVLFPVLHGKYGEDGSLQGLMELADIPYVGAGVLGSAVGMDKIVQKQILAQEGIPIPDFISFTWTEYIASQAELIKKIEKKLKYPCFVKPANTGSSVGISKAHNRKELLDAIEYAGQYDRRVIVEKAISHAREIECSVLGNDDPIVSMPGEIVPSNEFYDYDAKYVDGKSKVIIPARLPKSAVEKIRTIAVRTFKALDCSGMARVDFFVVGNGRKIYLNEINTIPGFTSISMYPKLWEASGLSYPVLLEKLIQLAIDRYNVKKKLRTKYHPKKKWYR
jgi:D-alanine-D-alanine ligase